MFPARVDGRDESELYELHSSFFLWFFFVYTLRPDLLKGGFSGKHRFQWGGALPAVWKVEGEKKVKIC